MAQLPELTKTWNRRRFTAFSARCLFSVLLLKTGLNAKAFNERVEPHMRRWYAELNEAGQALKGRDLTPEQWRQRIEDIHQQVPLKDLLHFIDFDRVVGDIRYPQRWGAIRDLDFPQLSGLPRDLPGAKIFAYRKDAATAPHGHNNMVSAHLILKGQFHVRTFHRVRDEAGYLILSPAIDRIAGPGEVVTMSDEAHNVHWFLAVSPHAYTLDVPVSDLQPGKPYPTKANRYGMIWVDPTAGKTTEGLVRAKVIDFQEAERRFARR